MSASAETILATLLEAASPLTMAEIYYLLEAQDSEMEAVAQTVQILVTDKQVDRFLIPDLGRVVYRINDSGVAHFIRRYAA